MTIQTKSLISEQVTAWKVSSGHSWLQNQEELSVLPTMLSNSQQYYEKQY